MAKVAGTVKCQEKVLVLRIDMSEALAKLDEEIRRRIQALEKGGR